MKDKRIALVRITREFLTMLLFKANPDYKFSYWHYQDSHTQKVSKIPKNIKMVGFEYRAFSDEIRVVLESPDFLEIPEGGIVKEIQIVFEAKK